MFQLLRALLTLILIYSLAAFWSWIVLIRTIIRFVRNPKRYCYLKQRPDPPEMLKRDFEHYYVNLDTGIELHYAQSGDWRKPLILFLHGFPEFWYSWRHQLREFQNDYYVVALDMRGFGQSGKPKSVKEYRLSAVVEDVRLLLSTLGKSGCILVGHDFGGAVAWRFAIQYPNLVDKLIIMNCPHPKAYSDILGGLNLKQWLRSWYIFFFQCPYLPEIVFRSNDMKLLSNMLTKPPAGCTTSQALTEEDIEAWKYTFQQPGAMTAALNYYRALVPSLVWKEEVGPAEQNITLNDVRPARPSIVQPPTMIIWGTNDIALGTSLAHKSLQYCQHGTLRLIEGASHWVQQDQPEIVNQSIHEFITSKTGE